MGSNISGFQNESDLISNLNEKRVYELNNNLKRFIYFLFGNLNENEIIYAHSGISGQKPDIIIEVNDSIKKVSVKIGTGNSVHQENINLFMEYLSSIGVSEDVQVELLKFHWGDGTIDNTGRFRDSSAEYKRTHENEINYINKELNNPKFLFKIVNRILFQGKSDLFDTVDAIYYGDYENGHWASCEEIFDYIASTRFLSDSIHFGPLNYQIWNRCLNFNPKTENRRYVMQVKWASLLQDIINIERNRRNNV